MNAEFHMASGDPFKAAILVGINSPLDIAMIRRSDLQSGQVLVRIAFSGVCGKQIDEITAKRGEDRFIPHLLGHEGAGVVEEIGSGVTKVKAGDHVVLHWMKGSGIDSVTPHFWRDGQRVNAGWVTTFSEKSVVSENRVTPIPAHVPLDVAALLGCAVTTGLGIVFNNAQLRPGQSIVVFGAGGVGLNVLQGARLISCAPIVAVDIDRRKLERAKAFGATHVFHAESPGLPDELQELVGRSGFDAAVDCTGRPEVIQTAYNATGNSGVVVLAGVPSHTNRITIDSFPLHFGRRIVGSHGGNTNPNVDIPRCLRLYDVGRLQLRELITHRYALDQINLALEELRTGDVGRCLISMV